MDYELLNEIGKRGERGYAIFNEKDFCVDMDDLINHFDLENAGYIRVEIYSIGHSYYRKCYITDLGLRVLSNQA